MKVTDRDKRIRTAPKSAWESGIINEKKKHSNKEHMNEIKTDAQGNGYPVIQKNPPDNAGQ